VTSVAGLVTTVKAPLTAKRYILNPRGQAKFVVLEQYYTNLNTGGPAMSGKAFSGTGELVADEQHIAFGEPFPSSIKVGSGEELVRTRLAIGLPAEVPAGMIIAAYDSNNRLAYDE